MLPYLQKFTAFQNSLYNIFEINAKQEFYVSQLTSLLLSCVFVVVDWLFVDLFTIT